jgi:hypothetical protein
VLGRGPLSDPTKETEDGDRYGIRPIASKQPEECTYGPTRTRAAVGEIPTEGAFLQSGFELSDPTCQTLTHELCRIKH